MRATPRSERLGRHWEHVVPFFAFPLAVRRIIYTTNQIESLNSQLRRAVRAHGHFPSDEAALKLVWLRLQQIAENWKMHASIWHAAPELSSQSCSVTDSMLNNSMGSPHTKFLTVPRNSLLSRVPYRIFSVPPV